MAIAKVVLNGETKMDTTQVTVTAANLAQGVTALRADGTLITGVGSNDKADMFPIPNGYSLPLNYQKLVYCDSSGTQICDTGFIATINTKIELAGYFIPGTYVGYGYMFGSVTPEATIATSGVSAARWFGFGDKKDFWSFGATANINFGIPLWTISAIEGRVQASPLLDASKECGATTMGAATNSICIFGRRSGNTNDRFSSVRFFRMRIWESDTLVRYIVPVLKDENEVCLYDVINGIYIPNIGTGVLSGVM